jgi:hypothetical protein
VCYSSTLRIWKENAQRQVRITAFDAFAYLPTGVFLSSTKHLLPAQVVAASTSNTSNKLIHAVTRLNCILEIPGWNLGLTKVFRCLPEIHLVNLEIVP